MKNLIEKVFNSFVKYATVVYLYESHFRACLIVILCKTQKTWATTSSFIMLLQENVKQYVLKYMYVNYTKY